MHNSRVDGRPSQDDQVDGCLDERTPYLCALHKVNTKKHLIMGVTWFVDTSNSQNKKYTPTTYENYIMLTLPRYPLKHLHYSHYTPLSLQFLRHVVAKIF